MSTSFHSHRSDLYVYGGSLRWYYKRLYETSYSMMSKSIVCRDVDQAIALHELYDRLLEQQKLNRDESVALYQTIFKQYEYLVDDILLISGFELYAKGFLMSKSYIPHLIIKPERLSKKQRSEPVHLRTLRAALRAGEDIEIDIRTLQCNQLFRSKYFRKIGIPNSHKRQLKIMNENRNNIHFQEPATVIRLGSDYLKTVKFLYNTVAKKAGKTISGN